VTLGAFEDYSIVCLASARGPRTSAPAAEPGMHVSGFATAMGRAYLAACGRLERQRIAAYAADRKPSAASELQKTIQAAVSEYGRRGYCTTIEGWRKGQNGIAVPLYLKNYGRRLVLGCGGPSLEVTPETIHGDLSVFLLDVANEIEVAFESSGGARRKKIRSRPG